jgi:hypothetical protein
MHTELAVHHAPRRGWWPAPALTPVHVRRFGRCEIASGPNGIYRVLQHETRCGQKRRKGAEPRWTQDKGFSNRCPGGRAQRNEGSIRATTPGISG